MNYSGNGNNVNLNDKETNSMLYTSEAIERLQKNSSHFFPINFLSKESSYGFLKTSEVSSFTISSKEEKNTEPHRCSLCNTEVSYLRYVCLVCKNFIFCSDCEKFHLHPLCKIKGNAFTSLEQVLKYIKRHNFRKEEIENNKNPNIFKKMTLKKIKLKLSVLSNKFSMRQNKKIIVPITIENLTKNEPSKDTEIYLYSKDTKEIVIQESMILCELRSKEQAELNIVFESLNIKGTSSFTLEIYATGSDKEIIESNNLSFTVTVDDDQEDEELNNFFKDYPKLLVLEKEQKKIIKYIIDEKLSKEHPYMIMSILKNNKWNKEISVNQMIEQNILEDNINEMKEKENINQDIIEDIGL